MWRSVNGVLMSMGGAYSAMRNGILLAVDSHGEPRDLRQC